MPEKKFARVSWSARANARDPTPSAVSAGAREMPRASHTKSAIAATPAIQIAARPMPAVERRAGLLRP